MSVDPRLRVLYLAGVAVAAFLVKDARIAAALVVAHAIAWVALGEGARSLARQITKLVPFAAFVVASYALTSEDAAIDRWVKVPIGPWHPAINVGGAFVGGLMVLRVLLVVFASRVARSGDPRAIARGLSKLGAPDVVAASMDAVLALLGGMGRGGGGGGGGGGRRHADDGAPSPGFLASLRRIASGDVGAIAARIDRQIERVERHLEEGDASARSKQAARDIAVVAGLSLTMLGIKALKVLPSIPFAPGHKLVLLTPLYVVAAVKTRSRVGATLTGLVMGSVAFLLGDGRYGIFEIAKHVAPGLVCDLLVPLVVRGATPPGRVTWSIVGGAMGLARFTTIFVVMFTVQAPAAAWAVLVPGLLVHTTFGVLSGLVSAPLLRAVLPRAAPALATSMQDAPTTEMETRSP